jgi:hypothetical protein
MSVRSVKTGIRPLAFPGKAEKSPDQATRERILAQTTGVFVMAVDFLMQSMNSCELFL